MCPDCDVEMTEDIPNGIIVCTCCGICETLLIPDRADYRDVDWSHVSMATKSQHKPSAYVKNLVRKYGIDSKIEDELLHRYQSVLYWSERHKPAGRKSMPSYVSEGVELHVVLLCV